MKILSLSNLTHGWIDITFGQEPGTYTITASDVPNDCLRELASAMLLLLAGSDEEKVEFSLEPGFAVCRFRRDADLIRVVINRPDQHEPVFDTAYPLASFAKRVRFELLRIKSQYSGNRNWTHPFPDREVADLGAKR